jgi:Flp pilus assembly protein TadB
MRAPPIAIRCDCGEVRRIPYGERWRCHRCGRTWDTAQIPAEEYWTIMRDLRRLRLGVIATALGLALVFAVLALLVSPALFLLLPVILAGWFIWYMPWWRRKLRRRVRSLPTWNLRPE